MKAGILTFHRADNYGAMLQAYALVHTFEELGVEATIIDYRCEAIETYYSYRIKPHFHINPYKYIKELRRNIHTAPDLLKKANACRDFREKYLSMGQSVCSEADRKQVEDDYDLIVTGSDQIWSGKITHGRDQWYLFHRSQKNNSVISYAASAGNLAEFKENFQAWKEDFEGYNAISVREKELMDYLQKQLQRDISLVLDPTLLPDESLWENFSKQNSIKEDYILYYDVAYNPKANRIVKDIAKKTGYKIVYFNELHARHFDSICKMGAGPDEFLSLIANAKYIVTSSFHATVFSIIFRKKFIVVPHPNTGSRAISLLNSLNLSERLVEKNMSFTIERLEKDIDYGIVFEKLEVLKEHSIKYMKNCIGHCQK